MEDYVICLLKNNVLFVSKGAEMCIVKQNWALKDIFITYVSLWKGIYLAAKSLNSNIMVSSINSIYPLVSDSRTL